MLPLAELQEADELLDNGAKLHVCPGPALITVPLDLDDLIGSCRCSEQGQILTFESVWLAVSLLTCSRSPAYLTHPFLRRTDIIIITAW